VKSSAAIALMIGSTEALVVSQDPLSTAQLATAESLRYNYPFGENTYNDIRSQELKCIADRNREWHYDGSTNKGTCPLKSLTPYKPYTPEHDIRAQVNQSAGWTYPFGENFYNDIRAQELKCIADRNREWHYNGATNTGTCNLKSLTPYKPYTPDHDIRAQVSNANGWTYPFGQNSYNDIRAQELKCLGNRNYEWHYDASTNTGSCTLNSYGPYKPFTPENDIRAQKTNLNQVESYSAWTYQFGKDFYTDIRSQELKCLADRNSEWHYDGATNTGTCNKKSFTPYKEFTPENDIRAQANATASAVKK
jgi:hypothetical protein